MDKQPSLIKLANLSDEEFKLCDLPLPPPKIKDNKKNNNQKFKEQYFAYYDDVKSPSLKKQDW